jgi:site-specific recombinase XerD
MNSLIFHSALAESLATFIRYKQALNRRYRTEAFALRLFDRYLCAHHVGDWESIDHTLIDNFLKSRPRAKPRSYNHLVGVLRRFYAWAVLQGFTRCNPVNAPLRRETSQQMRYLFDLSDAKRLVELSLTGPEPVTGRWFTRLCSPCSMAWACGLARRPDSSWTM